MRFDAEVTAAVSATRRLYGLSLDPKLIHAVIERESSHTAPARGKLEPNGHLSYGPMQVQDSTAAMHGIQDPSTLLVPSIGIRVGTYELARLLKHFSGDVARALSGYNAGQGRAVRDKSGRFPNQSYVNAVLGFWRSYGGAIAAGSAAGLLAGGVALFLAVALVQSQRRRRRAA